MHSEQFFFLRESYLNLGGAAIAIDLDIITIAIAITAIDYFGCYCLTSGVCYCLTLGLTNPIIITVITTVIFTARLPQSFIMSAVGECCFAGGCFEYQ